MARGVALAINSFFSCDARFSVFFPFVLSSTPPPRRVATAGMADLAAPVKKSTWPTRPVATPGAAHPAAPVPHADQAPTSTAVPALPHSILPMSKRKATLMDQQLTDLSQLLGATEAKKRMADIIVDRMAASYSAHCDSNEAFVYR